MPAPHLRFRHLDAAVLTATGALLEARTSELPPDQALAEYQQWADTASAAYHLTRVAVRVGPEPSSYIPQGTLRLARPGIVALLAGYRRHMQSHGITPVGSPDQDAYGWALSLYHTVRPRQLARLVRAGRMPYMAAADLDAPDPVGRIAHRTPADLAVRASDAHDDPRLRAARDFIRRAADERHVISAGERDRYLAVIDEEERRAPR